MSKMLDPKLIAPGAGRQLRGPGGDRTIVKLAAADTAGQLSLAEYIAEPDVGPPLHTHTLEDEVFYILEGEVTFFVGGRELVADAGSVVFGPRGVPHTFKNRTRTVARMLLMVTPPGSFEAFYAKISALHADGRPPSDGEIIERIMREAPVHGITIHGPNPL